MKFQVLPALAAVLAATAHADNAPVGTLVAMPADIADILARNTTTPSRDERFASAEAAVLYQATEKATLPPPGNSPPAAPNCSKVTTRAK